ncbi:MAG: hypothetical protein Q7T12_01950 [Flavobacterium sp.]|nr:hypothetical protein [Flavobacterium sp.]
MKKLLFVFIAFFVLSCSKSDDNIKDGAVNSNNYIELNGKKYYFDNVTITRKPDYANATTAKFEIVMQNTPLKNHLFFQLYANPNLASDNVFHLYSGTYAETNKLYAVQLGVYDSNNNYIPVFNDDDFVTYKSRVIVTEHADSSYTFSINFITSLGNVVGTYTGKATKVGY